AAASGNGNVLGNIYTAALGTVDAGLTDLSNITTNVNALLAKAVGVFNASTLTLSSSAIASLPSVYQTLANPTLINSTPGANTSFFDWNIGSATGTNPLTSV